MASFGWGGASFTLYEIKVAGLVLCYVSKCYFNRDERKKERRLLAHATNDADTDTASLHHTTAEQRPIHPMTSRFFNPGTKLTTGNCFSPTYPAISTKPCYT